MAGGRRIVWRCWKCTAALAEMQGTFERPEVTAWKPLELAEDVETFPPAFAPVGNAGCCTGCGAYNVLKPAGMNARLQEEETA